MRIIVIGAGKVGFTIAEHLIAEEHDVIIIDKNEEVVERCTGSLDALCIRGNGANAKILLEAGVVSGYDSTPECAIAKLMFLLGHKLPTEKIREMMNSDLCGEITK